MLAPVFNGLLTFYEVALGRPIVVGRAELSSDEHALLRIVDGLDDHPITMSCSEGMAAAFSCAVRSARIMMAKVLAERIGPHRPTALVPIPLGLKGEERLFPWDGVNAEKAQHGQPFPS